MSEGSRLRALVVEDDRNIRRSVATALTTTGWTVHESQTLRDALRESRVAHFDLAVIDLGLPDGDGVDLIVSIRGRSPLPIIVLSARSEEHQKVVALDAGADDYVEKPFRVGEFLARVRAHMRRRDAAPKTGDPEAQDALATVIGNVELDPAAHLVRKGGKDVHLTRKEYELFGFLVRNAGRVLTHRQLLHAVWGPSRIEHSHYLRVFMASLRQKLEDDPSQPKLIVTETGVGYRLMV